MERTAQSVPMAGKTTLAQVVRLIAAPHAGGKFLFKTLKLARPVLQVNIALLGVVSRVQRAAGLIWVKFHPYARHVSPGGMAREAQLIAVAMDLAARATGKTML